MKYVQFYLGTFGAFKKTLCSEYLLGGFLYNCKISHQNLMHFPLSLDGTVTGNQDSSSF